MDRGMAWLMRLCLFVVMIRTRDRREGRSKDEGRTARDKE